MTVLPQAFQNTTKMLLFCGKMLECYTTQCYTDCMPNAEVYSRDGRPMFSFQTRIGRRFIALLNIAAKKEHVSRNELINKAMHHRLAKSKTSFYPLRMQDVTTDRVLLQVRADTLLIELINEQCEELNMRRTNFVMDCCLTYLAEFHPEAYKELDPRKSRQILKCAKMQSK